MARAPINGLRPPSYPSKATLAAELDMCESTVDSYVKRGLLPKPLKMEGSIRWCWAEVVAHLNSRKPDGNDDFMSGLDNV